MKELISLIFVFFLIFLITSCATGRQTGKMLNDRLGRMTFEEALQRFGPPSNCAEAGATRTCIWVYGRGGTIFVPAGNLMVAAPIGPPTARLTFTNNRLSNWRLTGKWE